MRRSHLKKLVVVVFLTLLFVALSASAALAVDPDVTLTKGPTAIVNGSCLGVNDITISNGYFAIAIAADTTPPWGVPKGSILDGTTITDGVWGRDKLTLVDFLPNAWAAWPNTYQTITVTKDTADQAVITIARDYNKLELVTTITVDRGSRFAKMSTVAANPTGSGETYADIYCGYTFCTSGGFMFGPYAVQPGTPYPSVSDPYGKYVLGYDSDYSIGLHFKDADVHDGGTGWKDLYETSTLAPGATQTFDASVQFEDSASISRFVKTVIDERADPKGTVSGAVSASTGSFPEPPIVVVEKNGEPFTWVVAESGNYELVLPVGDYQLYAVAKGFAASAKVAVSVTDAGSATQDFTGLVPQSTITATVTRAGKSTPIDARIAVIGGTPPLVGFLGKSVFFTDLTDVGTAEFQAAPGELTLIVTAGDHFTSKAASVPITVVAGQDQEVSVKVPRLFDPGARRWYSADMHHHSNILDGVTSPEYLVRSQLAAGLDFTLVSDHDSFANNQEIRLLSAGRGVPFISSDEISPIWAHFNVLPLSLTSPVTIDPAGTAQQIIDGAHAAGMMITLNHPYIAYGYFTAVDDGTIPGGYYDGFDTIELQSTAVTESGTSPDERTLARTLGLWTSSLTGENPRYYLVGSTDTHDVWSSMSGAVRTYANLRAPLAKNQANFIKALKAGHSYVTEGPLVQPMGGKMFGDTMKLRASQPVVEFGLRLSSVDGLKSITVLKQGEVAQTKTFKEGTTSTNAYFVFRTTEKTWFSFIIEDQDGHRAVTNPIWTRMVR